MRTLDALVMLTAAAGVFAQADDTTAEVTTDNPAGAKYVATFAGDIEGTVLAGSDPFGIGVTFHVDLTGLPEDEGPFGFHIHKEPVPEDGNCTSTSGHFDPFGRGGEPACDSSAPETCEVGDLSGKHGKLDGSDVGLSFLELYASLAPDTTAFFGNRSIVIHNADGDRIACASLEPMSEEEEVEAEEEEEEEDEC